MFWQHAFVSSKNKRAHQGKVVGTAGDHYSVHRRLTCSTAFADHSGVNLHDREFRYYSMLPRHQGCCLLMGVCIALICLTLCAAWYGPSQHSSHGESLSEQMNVEQRYLYAV